MVSTRISEVLNPSSILGEATNAFNAVEVLIIRDKVESLLSKLGDDNQYDLTNEDRDFLEPAGFNLIVRRRGFGVMLFSNNTGYQTVKSALNNIHVREALVTIERDVERILFNFLFDFNDPTTRLRVKTLVKNYMASVQDANGVTTYDVIFDDSNNGVEVLENNAGVIDIIVNFPRGIQKFINRITITRANGQLSSQSTGFTPSF